MMTMIVTKACMTIAITGNTDSLVSQPPVVMCVSLACNDIYLPNLLINNDDSDQDMCDHYNYSYYWLCGLSTCNVFTYCAEQTLVWNSLNQEVCLMKATWPSYIHRFPMKSRPKKKCHNSVKTFSNCLKFKKKHQ